MRRVFGKFGIAVAMAIVIAATASLALSSPASAHTGMVVAGMVAEVGDGAASDWASALVLL